MHKATFHKPHFRPHIVKTIDLDSSPKNENIPETLPYNDNDTTQTSPSDITSESSHLLSSNIQNNVATNVVTQSIMPISNESNIVTSIITETNNIVNEIKTEIEHVVEQFHHQPLSNEDNNTASNSGYTNDETVIDNSNNNVIDQDALFKMGDSPNQDIIDNPADNTSSAVNSSVVELTHNTNGSVDGDSNGELDKDNIIKDKENRDGIYGVVNTFIHEDIVPIFRSRASNIIKTNNMDKSIMQNKVKGVARDESPLTYNAVGERDIELRDIYPEEGDESIEGIGRNDLENQNDEYYTPPEKPKEDKYGIRMKILKLRNGKRANFNWKWVGIGAAFILTTVTVALYSSHPIKQEVTNVISCVKNPEQTTIEFRKWLKNYDITYTNEDMLASMLEKYIENDKYICEQNLMGNSYVLAHNKFSGMNRTDWVNFVEHSGNHLIYESRNSNIIPYIGSFSPEIDVFHPIQIPKTVDWVASGAVSAVKDQGLCGSSWAFSTIATLESAYKLAKGKQLLFSEQELINCNKDTNHGCKGGNYYLAMQWIQQNGGISEESVYPYHLFTYFDVSDFTPVDSKFDKCDLASYNQTTVSIKSINNVPQFSDAEFTYALSMQPLSVSISASCVDFQFYSEGVFSDIKCSGMQKELKHAVTVVGYNNISYTIKNSWGTTWGNNGFADIKRVIGDTTEGQSGILSFPTYMTLE